MKKLVFLTVLMSIGIVASAYDWDGIPIPTTDGTVWVLDTDHSDDFNYNGKSSSEFTSRWNDHYHNAWTGPGLTLWQNDHSDVKNGNLEIRASRNPEMDTDLNVPKVNCGVITSKTKVKYPFYTEIRMKVMNQTLSSNYWMLSSTDRQELDVNETYGSDRLDHVDQADHMNSNWHIFDRDPATNEIIGNHNWQRDHRLPSGAPLRDDYHIFGVHLIDAWHIDWYLNGVLVRSTSPESTENPIDAISDPVGFATGDYSKMAMYEEMFVIIDVEDHDWRSDGGHISTDAELADPTKNIMYVDWVRFYKPAHVAVTGISISQTSLGLRVGDVSRITGTVSPSNATDKWVNYSSNNELVATIDANGFITTKGTGTATITASSNEGNFTKTCVVTVSAGAAASATVEAEDFTNTNGTFNDGTVPLGVNKNDGIGINYVNTGDWATYDFNISTTGVYEIRSLISTPKTSGQIKITIDGNVISTDDVLNNGDWDTYYPLKALNNVNLSSGPHTLRIDASSATQWQWNLDKITFTLEGSTTPSPVTGVSVSPTSATLVEGLTSQLTATVAPVNATNKGVSWSSNNTSVATVDDFGLVTAVSVGSATITVTTDDGNKEASSSITVTSAGNCINSPITVEAESFTNTGGNYDDGQVTGNGVNNSGTNIDYVNSGDWVEYIINVCESGEYEIDYSISSPKDNAQIQIAFDGTTVSTDDVVNNGSWDTYRSLVAANKVSLTAGVHTMIITASGTNEWQWNLDKITLTLTGTTPNRAPVANAGIDQTLAAGTTTASLSGSGTDADGDALTYSWSKVSGPTATISNGTSANASVSGLTNGSTYVFRLTVSDGSLSDTDDVQISVANNGNTDVIVIEAETFTNTNGTYNDGNVPLGVNNAGTNINWVNSGDYADYSISVGQAGEYKIEYLISSPMDNAQIQIAFDGTTASTDNVVNSGQWDSYQTLVAGSNVNLSAGSHDVRITASGSNAWQWNLDKVTLTLQGTTPNTAPVANAGSNQTLAAGITTASLSGSGTDADGDALTYSWSKVSGPAATISNGTSANASVSGLTNGSTYVFRLTVSDGSLTDTDDVQITVNAGNNNPDPVITIEAESFTSTNGTYNDGNVPLGANKTANSINWVNNGDYMDYPVNGLEEGSYEIVYYISSPITGSTISFSVDGGTALNTTTVPNNGQWDTYQALTVSETVNITAGNHTIRLTAGAQTWTWNLDKFTIQKVGALKSAEEESLSVNIYPNPVNEILYIIDYDNNYSNVRIYNLGGQLVLDVPITEELNVSHLNNGMYILQLIGTDVSDSRRLIIQK